MIYAGSSVKGLIEKIAGTNRYQLTSLGRWVSRALRNLAEGTDYDLGS